ncbi:MAG: hypothetical protein JWQ63_2449 [Mucilaginibacter sp.]|nr:hypothetical protein [Mucilaginibacter sp.]
MRLPLIKEGNVVKGEKMMYCCPKCESEFYPNDRIHRGFFVKTFLFWLPLKRYQCHNCKRKSYLWG